MSLAYSLLNSLAETETKEDITTLVIDHYTREIRIPKGITTLGVTSDDDVLRLNFKMPRYLGTVDLYNFSIRVNYINAIGEDDVYKVTDKTVVGDNITFSWLVGPTAVAYKGVTKFNVCMVVTDANSVIKQEYNTAPASLPVKEGLECSERVISEYTDILEQWESRLFGIGDTEEAKLLAFSEEQQTNITEKGAEVLATIPEDYQTTYKLANEGVRSKADAIICSAEGEIISVSDSSDDHIRGLRVFGKTTQVKTTGKNLLPITSPSRTSGGITYTVQEDGGIHVKGTSTANSWFVGGTYPFGDEHLTYLPAGEYFLSGNSEPSITGYINGWYEDGTATLQINDVGNGGIPYVIASNAYVHYQIMVAPNVTVDTVIYPQLELGSTATSYEPYTGGKPAPNPDYPQELENIENPTVDIYGKNLLNITATTQTSNGITFTVKEDKTVVINGTATADAYCGLTQPFILNPGKYILSGCTSGGSNTYFLYSDVGAIYNRDSEVEFIIDTHSERKFFIKVHSGITVNNVVVKPMLRLANVDDNAYEAPKEAQTATLNYTLPGIPVTSGGNYTDSDGQQWICDEIDFERGVYVQRMEQYIYDGSEDENWKNGYSSNGINNRFELILRGVPVANVVCESNDAALVATNAYCSHFGYQSTSTRPDVNNFRISKTVAAVQDWWYMLFVPDTTIIPLEDLDAWKTYLAENPITVMVPLVTPIETPLTADEIAAFQALKTNYPNTTVLNDAGAWMNLRYNADTETWITNLIDEKIAAAVANL